MICFFDLPAGVLTIQLLGNCWWLSSRGGCHRSPPVTTGHHRSPPVTGHWSLCPAVIGWHHSLLLQGAITPRGPCGCVTTCVKTDVLCMCYAHVMHVLCMLTRVKHVLKDVLKDVTSLCFLSCGGEATQGAISSIACPAAAFFRTEMCPLQNGRTDRRTDLLRILYHFNSFYVCFILVSWTCGHGYFGTRLGITLSTLLVRAFATQCQLKKSEFQGSLSVPFSGRWQTRWLARRAGKCGAEQQERRARCAWKTFDFSWSLAFSCRYLTYFSDLFWCYSFNIARLLDHEDQSSVKLPVGSYCGHILWTFVE